MVTTVLIIVINSSAWAVTNMSMRRENSNYVIILHSYRSFNFLMSFRLYNRYQNSITSNIATIKLLY